MEEIVGLRDVRRAQDGKVLSVHMQSMRAATSSPR